MRCDHHALDVEMVVKTLDAAFAANAGIINAAPGRGRVKAMVIVDPDDAGLDASCKAMGAADVAGADCSRQPKRRVVGQPQRIGLVLERGDRGEGAEYFFLEDAHVRS